MIRIELKLPNGRIKKDSLTLFRWIRNVVINRTDRQKTDVRIVLRTVDDVITRRLQTEH